MCKAFRGLIVGALIGLAGQAYAFDVENIDPDTPSTEALRFGLDSYRHGDKQSAIEALSFAAEKGHPIAQWQLGRMYAEGDGIERDDYKAFQMFSEMANEHADDNPNEANSRFVSSAFIALGGYYRHGIPNTDVDVDLRRARQLYAYAASYFGDEEAQLKLAQMYLAGEGGDRDPVAAARWAKLAADKGNVEAQALLGHLLFEGDGVDRQPVLGLTYLTVARANAAPSERWIFDMQEKALSVATESERRTAMALADDWLDKDATASAN